MALDPEPIRAALLERLSSSVTGIAKWWEIDPGVDVVGRALPCAILLQESVSGSGASGLPTLWELTFQLSFVVEKARDDLAPDAELNGFFVQAQDALLRQATESSLLEDGDEVYTTLGGLAVRCRILGTVEYLPGVVSGQSGLVVPISVLALGA